MGGDLLYSTKISKSPGYAHTLVQPDQNFGEGIKIERSHKVLYGKAKEELKIKMTSLMHSLGTIFGLGITWGTYNIRKCLFVCMTATLSAEILSIDAQPYEGGPMCHMARMSNIIPKVLSSLITKYTQQKVKKKRSAP